MSILLSVVVATTCAISAPKLYDCDVSNAIEMISEELNDRHDEVRCWDSVDPSNGWLSRHRGGTTALTTLALLASGQSSNSPSIQRALDYIWEVEEPSAYLLTLRISIWAQLPDTYKKRLVKDTKKLINTLSLKFGGWGTHAAPPTSVASTSPLTREFGIIALREAHRRGIRVPKKCWTAIANATLTAQQSCGGWSYEQSSTSGDPTANMTVAGLNCLLGVDEMIGDELHEDDSSKLQSSINEALLWLDNNATTKKNYGGTSLMSYLYALERAAMSCGLSDIRNRDWYLDGAEAILKTHCGVRKARGSTVNLSFALLFLTRGRAPIAFCELVKDKGAVDPHRVAEIITNRVSTKIERPLAWQLVSNEENIQTWLTAPFMLIQDELAIPTETIKLKEYLHRGGLLVMLATGKTLRSCKEFAAKLSPSTQPSATQRDHWAHNLFEDARNINLTVWNDGIRDRIIVIQGDGKKLIRSDKSKLSMLLTNLCLGAGELDRWQTRLPRKELPFPSSQLILAQHQGCWDSEITGFDSLNIKIMPLEKSSKKRFVWVGGIHSSEVEPRLVKTIVEIAKTGTTIFVESIGGHGHFASTVQQQFTEQSSTPVKAFAELQQFNERRGWSIYHRKKIPVPQVAKIGTGSVIFIDCDIRNALIGRSSWGIHGYSTQAAKGLLQYVLCN